jgi:predicted aspartyl protease
MRQGSRCISVAVVGCFITVMSQAIAGEVKNPAPVPAALGPDGTASSVAGRGISGEVPTQSPGVSQRQAAGAGSVVRVSVRENGRLLVPLAVNGKKEYRFLFDTGATTTVISERVAAKAGVRAGSTAKVYTFAGKVSLSAGRVEMLGIGNRGIAGIEVLIADLGRLFNLDPEVDGILGEDVLSRFNYLLDRRGRKLEIEQEDNLSPTLSGTKVSFEKRSGKIYVPAAGGAVRLMLDSGNPYLVIYEDVASKLQTVISPNIKGDGAVGSSAGRRAIRACRIVELEIGDSRLRNVEAFLSERDAGRPEDGFLPLHFFDSIYVNNLGSFLIANPQRNR